MAPSLLGLLLANALVGICAVAEAETPVAASPPPDLQRLEASMLALQVSSERFAASIDLGGSSAAALGPLGNFAGGRLAHLATLSPFASSVGEASFSPRAASYESSLLGLKSKVRVIGETRYTYEPLLAGADGGRPWIREHDDGSDGATGLGGLEDGGEAGGEGQSHPHDAADEYRGLAKLLSTARSIVELGSSTVDAQASTGFRAVLAPPIPVHPDAATKRELRAVRPIAASVEVFFAESGLPVRTTLRTVFRLQRNGHHFEVADQTDTLAINVPVQVLAPPAAKTIGEHELDVLLERRLREDARRRHEPK
jgi:hypothetical protein